MKKKIVELIIAVSLIFIYKTTFAQITDSLIRLKEKQKLDYYFSHKDNKIVGVGLKAVLKACYTLPPDEDTYYFLIEIKLINNSDTLFETITYNCTTYINIIFDSKELKLFKFPCSSNSPIPLRLKSKEEFSIPILLKAESKSTVFLDPVKFGFIVLSPKNLDIYKVHNRLMEMRNKQENVIWSDKLYFEPTNEVPFEIKRILDDSTYVKQRLP